MTLKEVSQYRYMIYQWSATLQRNVIAKLILDSAYLSIAEIRPEELSTGS